MKNIIMKLNEEVNRIKGLIKYITEDVYNVSGLSRSGNEQGFRFDNYSDNDRDFTDVITTTPNYDYKTPPTTSSKKEETPVRLLTLDNDEDRIKMIEMMIKGKKLKNLVDGKSFSKIVRVYNRYSSDGYFNTTQILPPEKYVTPENFTDTFDIEIMYFLLKEGKFRSIDGDKGILLSKTFNKLIIKSKYYPDCYMFRQNNNITVNKFVNFMKKKYEKIESEIIHETRKKYGGHYNQ